jgi:exonuclease SbcC
VDPIRVKLNNFLSYTDEEVDLTGVTCAAVCGPNGAGKSSLMTDALTWCLFGQGTKGGVKELDNYVTRGQVECRVELDLRLAGQTYRVIRGRSTKGKSTLEVFIQDAGDWHPISGKTIAETQAAIEGILRMNYPTFTASALVLQGQSDTLTANMTDAERKEVLARILGLDVWDRMQERVREKGRGLKAELAAVDSTRQRLQDLTKEKPVLEARRATALVELAARSEEIDRITAQLADLEAQIRQKPMLEQTLGETSQGISKANGVIRTADDEIARAKDSIAGAEGTVRKNEALLARRSEIEAAVDAEAEIAGDVAEWVQKAQEHIRLSADATFVENRAREWDRETAFEAARFEAQIQAATRQASTMDQVPCSGDTRANCPLLAGAKAALEEKAELVQQLADLKAQLNPYTDDWRKASQARDAVGYDAGAHQAAQAALADVRKTSGLMADLQSAATLTATMEEILSSARETIAAAEARRTEAQAERAQLVTRQSETQAALNALAPAAQTLADRQHLLSHNLRPAEASLRTELGRLDASLEQVAKAEAELATLETQTKAQRDELTVYELLDQACGKKAGVPALIVENAVPEIERLANDMLCRMAGGRLAVRLDTQAEGKSTGTLQEVLRITVLDGGTERPYQTYSGAERFMVDLALRVALSKFLSHRAGAEIRLFVLDEGLGACDQTNRQAVMEAIQAVAREFGKALVITHIPELQDALPQRIEVTKGPDGSRVKVVA